LQCYTQYPIKMEHEIIHKKHLSGHHWLLVVNLIPKTPEQNNAIKSYEIGNEPTQEEEGLVINYLLFLPEPYSILELISKKGTLFTLKASDVN